MARVWDKFLTPQDRAYDRLISTFSKKHQLGQRPALLLIDLYREAFGDHPQPLLEAVRTNPMNLGLAGWQALPHLQRLLEVCRAADILVIHVSQLVEVSEWETLGPAKSTRSKEAIAERDRRFEIIDQLVPLPGELTLRKCSASPFVTTAIRSVLIENRIDTVIVAGESTSGCVRATVVDARDLRYAVMVAEECTFDRTDASHAMSLYDMHRKYAHVVPLAEAVSYVRALPGVTGGGHASTSVTGPAMLPGEFG